MIIVKKVINKLNQNYLENGKFWFNNLEKNTIDIHYKKNDKICRKMFDKCNKYVYYMKVQRRNCVFSRENIYLNNNRSINLNYILNVVNNNYDGGCCVMRKKLGKVFGIIFVVLMIFSFNFNVKAEEVVSEVTENSESEVKETVQDSVSKEESNTVVKKEEVKNVNLFP